MAFCQEYFAVVQHSDDDFGHFSKQREHLKMNVSLARMFYYNFSQNCFLNILIVPVASYIHSLKNFNMCNK